MIKDFYEGYSWLSNFAKVEVKLNGVKYASVEHAYQSAKNSSPEWIETCSDPHNTAGVVKKKSKKIEVRPDWEEVKVDIMKELLIQKYNKEPFKHHLLNTGTQEIQEGNNHKDEFWGVNLATGEGKNMLGKLIMEIRTTLI